MGRIKRKEEILKGGNIPKRPEDMSPGRIEMLIDTFPGMRKISYIQASRNIPNIIARHIKEEPALPWTPDLILKRIYEETDPGAIDLYYKLGIDEAELKRLAIEGMKLAGIRYTGPDIVRSPKIPKRPLWIRIIASIKSFFLIEKREL